MIVHAPEISHELASLRLLRMGTVLDLTQLSETTLWRLRRRDEFPAPVRVTSRTIAWRAADVEVWIRQRANTTRAAK
jgi:prophage regulatory protein